MKNKLKNLVITKVALVDEGCCSAAHIKLYKRREGGTKMNFEEIIKALPEDQQAIVRAELAKAKAELPEGAIDAVEKAKLETQVTELKKQKATADEEIAKLKNPQNTNEEDILKSVDPAVRQMIEKARLQAVAAEEAVKKMKEDQNQAEAINKAKELPHVGAKQEELTELLKSLKGKDEALYAQVFSVLKTANNLIETGSVFEEIGKSTGNSDEGADAWNAIEKAAVDIAKSRNMSKEQAISVVMREQPDLYQNYVNSQVD